MNISALHWPRKRFVTLGALCLCVWVVHMGLLLYGPWRRLGKKPGLMKENSEESFALNLSERKCAARVTLERACLLLY